MFACPDDEKCQARGKVGQESLDEIVGNLSEVGGYPAVMQLNTGKLEFVGQLLCGITQIPNYDVDRLWLRR